MRFRDLEIDDEFTFGDSAGLYRKINNNTEDALTNTLVLKFGGATPAGHRCRFGPNDNIIPVTRKSSNPPNKQSDIERLWEIFTNACDEESTASLVLCSDGSGYITPHDEYTDQDISFSSLQGAIDKIRGKKL